MVLKRKTRGIPETTFLSILMSMPMRSFGSPTHFHEDSGNVASRVCQASKGRCPEYGEHVVQIETMALGMDP